MNESTPAPDANEPLIGVYGVGKTYRIWNASAARLRGTLMGAVGRVFHPFGRIADSHQSKHSREFHALRGVTFEIQRGESVGIVGRNGSGKSTLLQIIAGTRLPTHGHVSVRGRVAAILELGSGFRPDFTGRENVYINGAILGIPRSRIDEKFEEIAAFADIGDFIDQPVKTYSSGMMVRLVFAVQVALEPDIFIVDEALAVGDVFFQQKCAARMQELKQRGTTLLFVSHSMQTVRSLCEKVLYLNDGQMQFFGSAIQGAQLYFSSSRPVHKAADKPAPSNEPPKEAADAFWRITESTAELAAAVTAVRVAPGQDLRAVRIGERAAFIVSVKSFTEDELSLHVAFNLKNSFDRLVTAVGTHTTGSPPVMLAPWQSAEVRIEVELNVEAGDYTFHFGVGLQEGTNGWQCYHSTPWMGPLTVSWPFDRETAPFYGPVGLPVSFLPLSGDA
ncbi:MAG TPA: ABC transporter ATP-binding protein [Chthoniobacterales bacterium]